MITFLLNSFYLLSFMLCVTAVIYYFFAYRALPDEKALRREDDERVAARDELRQYSPYNSPQKKGLAKY